MRVVCVANNKGGVGKTTSAINLSAAIAGAGYRVMLIDMDPQSNASTGLAGSLREAAKGTTLALMAREVEDIGSIALETTVPGMLLVPAQSELTGIEPRLGGASPKPYILRQALLRHPPAVDFIFIDTPPTMNMLSVNALMAADEVLVPIDLGEFAITGIRVLDAMIDTLGKDLDHTIGPDLRRILITMFDRTTTIHAVLLQDVLDMYPERLLKTKIPRNVTIREAQLKGRPISQYDSSCPGAFAYRQLADELLSVAPFTEGNVGTGVVASKAE
mgnify:CR=1 FL=1